jgi:hypothetical protein
MTDLGAFTPAEIPRFTLVTPTKTDTPKRPRGRPPGAKNRPKEPDLGVNPPMELGRGSSPKGPPPKSTDTVDQEANKKAEKKARAEEYAKYISEDINDKIFMAVVLLTKNQIKPEMFYLPGKAPAAKQSDERLSELGNAVAIPPDMASSWGKLLAELSYTQAGQSATKYAGNNNLAILGAALTAIVTTLQYVGSVKNTIEGIQQGLEEMQRIKEEQQENG